MDKRHLLAFALGATSLALGILVVRLAGLGTGVPPVSPPEDVDPPRRIGNLSGPYTHKNLTVYLVHGEDQISGKTPLTLDEAFNRKLVVVHETGDVDQLEIENLSTSEEIYVQAGDIVKGGKQDRVLTVDLLVPAGSGRIPISSFCVEQGRWTARGGESTHQFNSADEMVVSKDIKLAAKHSNSQANVWGGVAVTQEKLSSAANTSVASSASRSSLPLTLENKFVRESAEDYVTKLRSIIDGKSDVIGFVFAINGEINSGDTYAIHGLFEKLWPRLLKAAAIEAVAEQGDAVGQDKAVVTAALVGSFLSDLETAKISKQQTVTERISIVTRQNTRAILIESRDEESDSWLHRNYLME
jgi:hypothetical protein